MTENLLKDIKQTVIDGDYKSIGRKIRKLKRKNIEEQEIVKALSEGLMDISEKYKTKGMYLDNIVKAAATFELGTTSLRLSDKSQEPEKRVVIGVMGGPWTIGSSIIAANLKAHGFEVIDAGSDITPEDIINTLERSNAKIIASAIYLMQSKDAVEKLERLLWKKGLRHKIRTILSGPAASQNLADTLNIDAYAKNLKQVILKVKEFSQELKNEMSSYERVMMSLKHEEPDRVPVVPFAQTFSAKFAGIPFSEYVSHAETFLKGQLDVYKAFGWDALCFSSDVGIYAEALGAKISFPKDDVPRIVKPILTHGNMYNDFKNLEMPDPLDAGRLSESIKAIEMAKKQLGDEVPIIGWTEGPFQGLALLAGGDPMQVFYLLDHPDEAKEMLDWYADFEIDVARAMYEAGADIIGAGETAAYFMSPEFFKEFAFEPEKKACSKISKMGMPVLIHCCGYVPQCIHFVAETNPGGAIQFDYQVNLEWA
ncbi:MAG: hypothetical protein EU547_07685, partial [Promethearchaeota archaeon]